MIKEIVPPATFVMTSFLHASADAPAPYLYVNKGRPPVLMRTSEKSVESPNQFLRSLCGQDRACLMGKLRRISIEPGTLLQNENHPITTVYFPETVIVSIERQTGPAQHIETVLVGYEGLVGWSGLVGSGNSPQRAVVQMQSGTALGISVEDITAACEASRTLLASLMRFIEIVMSQMTQAIVSHLRDPIDRRVSRWLLMRHDRIPTDNLLIRHEQIAHNLGTRRASVTDCLHVLEGERLLRCHRGRIIVRDRAGLEARAGDSYGLAEEQYRALIGSFGRVTGVKKPPRSKSLGLVANCDQQISNDRYSASVIL